MNAPTRTVVLADDHDIVRRGLALLLEERLGCVVVQAASARDAVGAALEPGVDAVLLDYRLGEPDGMWALQRIREELPDLPVAVLSTFSPDEYVERALELGANGYILKDATVAQLAEALETIVDKRQTYLHPTVARRVMRMPLRAPASDGLTDRELQVLRLVVEGATNEEIAARLFVTEKTVKSHLSNVFRKLGVTNRTQAAMTALRRGIVQATGSD